MLAKELRPPSLARNTAGRWFAAALIPGHDVRRIKNAGEHIGDVIRGIRGYVEAAGALKREAKDETDAGA